MNWPEHLRVLARLTDNYEFKFKDYKGEPFTLAITSQSCWAMMFNFSENIIVWSDAELHAYLSAIPPVELVS